MYSLPSKETRLKNMYYYQGKDKMDNSDIASEIALACSNYIDWNNLFLSENFKKKFKNSKNIIGNIKNVSEVCGNHYDGNKVEIYVLTRHSVFDKDESDDISYLLLFEYQLNAENEIDDLTLLNKAEVYTINGEPVSGVSIEDIYNNIKD